MGKSSDRLREEGGGSLEAYDLDRICQRLSERFAVPADSIGKTLLSRALDKNVPLFLDSTLLARKHLKGHEQRVMDRLNSLGFWFIDGGEPILRWKSPDALSSNDLYITISEGQEAAPGQDLDALFKSKAKIQMRTVRTINFLAGDAVREERKLDRLRASAEADTRRALKTVMDAAVRGEEDID